MTENMKPVQKPVADLKKGDKAALFAEAYSGVEPVEYLLIEQVVIATGTDAFGEPLDNAVIRYHRAGCIVKTSMRATHWVAALTPCDHTENATSHRNGEWTCDDCGADATIAQERASGSFGYMSYTNTVFFNSAYLSDNPSASLVASLRGEPAHGVAYWARATASKERTAAFAALVTSGNISRRRDGASPVEKDIGCPIVLTKAYAASGFGRPWARLPEPATTTGAGTQPAPSAKENA